jgi:hypothetical protein
VTVYYNPNKREQAMLERDLPPGIFKAVIIFTVALVALVVGAVVGFGKLSTLVTSLVPNTSNGPFVAACLGFAALASLFIYAIQRNAALQRTWPTTTGRVESSGVHAFESRDNDDGRLRTKYRADVVYSYEVAGVRYTRDKLGSSETSSNIEKFARRIADRYPAGSTIEIHYNPANPIVVHDMLAAPDERQGDASRSRLTGQRTRSTQMAHRQPDWVTEPPVAVRPPSTTNCPPVVLDARSEQRKSTMSAISSAVV